MSKNKKPEPAPQSVTFLTPDDLAPILEQLAAHDAQLSAIAQTLATHNTQIAALEAGAVELESRVADHDTLLQEHEARLVALEAAPGPEPPDPGPSNGPDKATWEAHMIEYGIKHGDTLSTEQSIDFMLNHIYYDAARVHYQIADYTGNDEPWNGYAKEAAVFYRDQYVVPNNGALPGYQAFARGLRLDYERTGDAASKAAAILISQNAMYHADWTEPASTVHFARSREVAYAILSYIDAEALGEAKRDVRALRVTDAYGHLTQLMDPAQWGDWQVSPFMAGITAQALIADWIETADPRCIPALTALAEWLWTVAYHPPTHAMLYQLNPNNTSEGGLSTQGAPDLNMIIAPLYSWLLAQLGDSVNEMRFDELLLGQADAYLDQGKQWDQNYWWAFDGMAWREAR